LKHYIFGFNLYSFLSASQTLASLYVCFFPQIKKCMWFGFGEEIDSEDILSTTLKTYKIKPNELMSVVPLLVQKRKQCWIEISNTLLLCFIIFAYNLALSFPFLLTGHYF